MPIIIPSKILDKLESWGASIDKAHRLITYLKHFRYLAKDGEITLEELRDAILQLQVEAGISADGVAGEKTLGVMDWPRCGVVDTELMREDASNPSKWGLSTLTYFIEARDSDMGSGEWDEIIAQAFAQWEDVCSLKFSQVSSSSKANLIIGIGSGGRDNFDGPSGTLAWAYLPPSYMFKGQLKMKFDTGETWVNQSAARGIRLLNVATHEFGHMLGLNHSKMSSALMAPFYARDIIGPRPNDDIPRIQSLYGKPTSVPAPEPKPEQPTTPPVPPVKPPAPGETIIRVNGNISNIAIDGYRIYKMN